MKKTWRWVALALVAAAVVGGTVYAVLRMTREEESTGGEVVEIVRGELVETAAATGTIEPHVQVEVKSEVSGEVIEVLVEEGQTVQAGQLLFRIDPTDAERALAEARVSLRRATADLAQARANLTVSEAEAQEAEAARDVSERGLQAGVVSAEAGRTARSSARVAGANVEVRSAAVKAAEAALAAARLAVADAEERVADTRIEAPIAGTVLNVGVEMGSIVASAVSNVSGGDALATLADLSDLRVIGAIDEAQIGRVAVGQAVAIRVDAYTDRVFEGRVIRVSPLGVEQSNVVIFDVEIRVTDAQAALLRSGMSADVEIETSRQEGVLVPLAAVHTEGPRRFVEREDGTDVTIRTTANDGQRLLVVEGLEEGDRVRVRTASRASGESRSSGGLFGPPRPRGGTRGGHP